MTLKVSILTLALAPPILATAAAAQVCETSLPGPGVFNPTVTELDLTGNEVIVCQPYASQPGVVGFGEGLVRLLALAPDGTLVPSGTIASPSAGGIAKALGESLHRDGDQLILSEEIAVPGPWHGVAHVMRLQGGAWVLEATLEHPDAAAAASSRFADEVLLSGDLAFVGAPEDSGTWTVEGAVHVFRRGALGWSHVTKLTAGIGNEQSSFGSALAFDGTRLFVGARSHSLLPPFANSQGAVFVYEEIGGAWVETANLQPTQPASASLFGYDLAVEGARLVVGAPGQGFGAAFVMRRSSSGSWTQEGRLEPLVATQAGSYGWDVAIDEGRVVVGGPLGPNAEVWGLTCVGWQRSHTFPTAPSDPALAIQGDRVLIGLEGTVFSYSLACTLGMTDCDPNIANATGLAGRLRAEGSQSASANNFTLSAIQLPPNQFGLALMSAQGGLILPPGQCVSGALCLLGPIARLNGDAPLLSNAAGEATLNVDILSIPTPLVGPVLPGQTWYFQYWHRNPDPVHTNLLTNSVYLTFN